MRVTIRKWGNSAALRLPASVMKEGGLQLDCEVDVSNDHGRVVIEPVRPSRYSLDELLSGITNENRHEEVSFGGAVGREAL